MSSHILLPACACHVQSAEGLVLEEPFNDCRLIVVALFLRFAYRPGDLTPHNLAAVQGSLLGLLRMAHKLDAQILGKVCKFMQGAYFCCSTPNCCCIALAAAAATAASALLLHVSLMVAR